MKRTVALSLLFVIPLSLSVVRAEETVKAAEEIQEPASSPLALKVIDSSSKEYGSAGYSEVTAKIEIKNVSKAPFKVHGCKDLHSEALLLLAGPDSEAFINRGGAGKAAKWEYAGSAPISFTGHFEDFTLQPGETCQTEARVCCVKREDLGASWRFELSADGAPDQKFCEKTEPFKVK